MLYSLAVPIKTPESGILRLRRVAVAALFPAAAGIGSLSECDPPRSGFYLQEKYPVKMLGSKGLLPPFDTGLLRTACSHKPQKKMQDSFRSESRIFFIDGGDLYAERTGYR